MPRILIADDQPEILQALRLLFKQERWETAMADSPHAVLARAANEAFDLLLIDLNYARDTTSGREGLDTLAGLRAIPAAPPVIVMTAWSNVPLAVEAMRLGAADFIEKPWNNGKLLELVRRHLEASKTSHWNGAPRLPMDQDLEVARSVQSRLLPREQPHLRTLEYAVDYHPAGHVGGDYYDFIALGEDEVAFVVADVSGKGISAAILMATIQSFFRSRNKAEFSDLAALVRSLNALFYGSSPSEQYATLVVLCYSDRTGKVRYLNCGHTPPLIVRGDGRAEELDAAATVIGLFESWSGRVKETTLAAGDTLLIFSDGITEAAPRDDPENQFGRERLLDVWNGAPVGSLTLRLDAVSRAIRSHCDGQLADDLTILALRAKNWSAPCNVPRLCVTTV